MLTTVVTFCCYYFAALTGGDATVWKSHSPAIIQERELCVKTRYSPYYFIFSSVHNPFQGWLRAASIISIFPSRFQKV